MARVCVYASVLRYVCYNLYSVKNRSHERALLESHPRPPRQRSLFNLWVRAASPLVPLRAASMLERSHTSSTQHHGMRVDVPWVPEPMEPTIVGGDPPLRRSKRTQAATSGHARYDDPRRDVTAPVSPVRSIDDASLRKAFDCKFFSTCMEEQPIQYAPTPVAKTEGRNSDDEHSSSDEDTAELERLKDLNLSIDDMMKVFRGEPMRHNASPVLQYTVPRNSPWSQHADATGSSPSRQGAGARGIWPPLPPEPHPDNVPPSTLWRDIALRAEARQVASLYNGAFGHCE